jgi:hypothetical protein
MQATKNDKVKRKVKDGRSRDKDFGRKQEK